MNEFIYESMNIFLIINEFIYERMNERIHLLMNEFNYLFINLFIYERMKKSFMNE